MIIAVKAPRLTGPLHSRPVHSARRHRRLTAWVALVAMLAFALVPTLSRAMAFASGDSTWAQICTPQGMRLVATAATGGADPADAPLQAAVSLDHCAFCSMASDGAVPLPAGTALPPLPLRSAEPPRLFLQAAVTLPVWRSAQPRGPPALS